LINDASKNKELEQKELKRLHELEIAEVELIKRLKTT
jgi:hypothetical protein